MENNIKKIREQQGITQAELGRRLKVTRSYVNKIENSKTIPNIRMTMRIAKILNCSLDDIF